MILSGSAGLTRVSGSAAFNFSGGTLQLPPGFTTNVPIVLNISSNNGTFDTHGNSITLANPLSGPGGLVKTGSGMLTLTGSSTYTGATSVSGGTLALLSDIPSSSFTANNGGTLLFNGATVNLNSRLVRAATGGSVQYQNATINGGFLRGPGTHTTLPGTCNYFSGATAYASTNFLQNGTDTFTDFANGGQVTNNSPLTWDGGGNAIGGSLVVNNAVSADDLTNAGAITINNGGILNNHLSDLTSGGGGRITVNSGGTLNADSQGEGVALDLQDSLLVNNGTVAGTTNIYYGATVKGSGTFGPINLFDGGTLAIAHQRQSPGGKPDDFQRQHWRGGVVGRADDACGCHDRHAQPDRFVDAFGRPDRRRDRSSRAARDY